jgi:hypothetical protein
MSHFFYDTVTTDHYLHVSQEEFLSVLQGMGVNFRKTFSQQDVAQPYPANAVLDVLNEYSDNRVLSNPFF